jgi:hypothetical protein
VYLEKRGFMDNLTHRNIQDLAASNLLLAVDFVNFQVQYIADHGSAEVITAGFSGGNYFFLQGLLQASRSIAAINIPADFVPVEEQKEFFELLKRVDETPRLNLISYNGPQNDLVIRFVHGHNLPKVIALAYSFDEGTDLRGLEEHRFAAVYYGSLGNAERSALDKASIEGAHTPPVKKVQKPEREAEFDPARPGIPIAGVPVEWSQQPPTPEGYFRKRIEGRAAASDQKLVSLGFRVHATGGRT